MHKKTTRKYLRNLQFKKYWNLCKKIIKSTKENFYKKYINQSTKTAKRFWEIFRTVTKQIHKNISSFIQSLHIENTNTIVPDASST